MLARHPKTGAPIRILTSDASIWRDAKTLVWLDGSENLTGIHWSRWDIGVSSLDAWKKVSPHVTVDVCVLIGPVNEVIRWLEEGSWKECRMIAIPKAVLDTLGLERLRALELTNSICLEEAIQLYPYLEKQWDKTEADSRAMLALILQYKQSFPIPVSGPHSEQAATLGLTLKPELETPAPLIFISQYFIHSKAKRAKEIIHCLKKNIECDYIDSIVLLNENLYDLPFKSPKVKQVVISERLRFDHVIRWIQNYAPQNALIAFANSDIYLDETWRILWSTGMADKFIALLRWEDSETPGEPPTLFGPRADSQDTWVVSAASVKQRKWDWESLKIPFGKGGCDNAFTVEMLRQKFLITNPCMSLYTHHVQASGIRNYDPADIVQKPVLMYVNPSGIHDLRPEIQISEKPFAHIESDARPLKADGHGLTDHQRTTFCRMTAKKWDALEQAFQIPAAKVPLYEFTNVSQTEEGLLRTYNSILVGPSKTASDAWSNTQLSVVSAHLDCDIGLVAYCPNEVAKSPVRYMLEYLGKILVLREKVGQGEWIAPRDERIVEALKLFSWQKDVIPVIERIPGFQIWCRKAYAWMVQDTMAALPTKQEVDALRSMLTSWFSAPSSDPPRIVFIVDDDWITEEFICAVEKAVSRQFSISCIYKESSLSTRVFLLRGASAVVVLGSQALIDNWGLIWALPVGAAVYDIQTEIDSTIEVMNLAAVSGLNHHLHIVPRAKPVGSDAANLAASIAGALLQKSVAVAKDRPLIVMPHPQTKGFFAHAGDSFREVVQIWAERGYVELSPMHGVSQIWLGSVGETLLYDRPTLEWLERSPAAERTFKKGLFGNPAPPDGGSPWTFWPRRPRLVEELVGLGIGKADWEDRSQTLVFYGRSENQVQMGHRTTHDWSAACSDFVHVKGEGSYPFSQRDYLKRLAGARFGLCLAGYGKKCHREVECMAMGCVPIVANEVDMSSYANPPKEGIHYFRVWEPEDAASLVKKIDKGTWRLMSAACRDWWRENASADGMWALTKRLAQL